VIGPVRIRPPEDHLWRRGVHPGRCVFPSKDIAETRARMFLAKQTEEFQRRIPHFEAWPEGEKPEA
jgi:hypothetical protein